MKAIYVRGCKIDGSAYRVTLESLVVISVYKNCQETNELTLYVVEDRVDEVSSYLVELDGLEFKETKAYDEVATYCVWPVIVMDETSIVSGLCAVCRHIVKMSPNRRDLLGFRESCLFACSETSIWTKFCEVDIINCTKQLTQLPRGNVKLS